MNPQLRSRRRSRPVVRHHWLYDRATVWGRGDVVGAHEADVRIQDQYGVNYKHYWVDEEAGKVFCLVDAPDRDTAARVHREAHGLEAHTLHLVEQGA